MNLTISSVRCALQIALLGAITQNLKRVSTKFSESHIDIYFYYDKSPSEEEEEISEEVSTEVMCSFLDISTEVHRIVHPKPNKHPQEKDKIPVFARYEPSPPEL